MRVFWWMSFLCIQLFEFLPADEMDIADDELRDTIRMIWPLQADKMVDILVPRREKVDRRILSTGKVYAGLLILESWRTTRFGRTQTHLGVSETKLLYVESTKDKWWF